MDAQTSILLAVKGLAAISEAALDVALGVINGNEGVVDVALAVDVVKQHVQDLHDLIGDHGNVIDNHDEDQRMSDDDDGGENTYEDLDDQGSDEMPRSGHRRGYHSKGGPSCTIDDDDDEDDEDAREFGTPKKTLRVPDQEL